MRSEDWAGRIPLTGLDGEPLTFFGRAEIEVVRSFLEACGFDVQIREPMRGFSESCDLCILVAAEQANEASAIVAQARAAAEAAVAGNETGDSAQDDVNSGSRGIL